MERFFHWKYLPIAAYVRLNGSIKVPAGAKKDSILRDAVAALKSGHKIWVYPEGGWDDKNQGRLRRGRKGVVYLHRATGAKIVPPELLAITDCFIRERFSGGRKSWSISGSRLSRLMILRIARWGLELGL